MTDAETGEKVGFIDSNDGRRVTIFLTTSRGGCGNCGEPIAEHCAVHLVPCCPGKCDWKRDADELVTRSGHPPPKRTLGKKIRHEVRLLRRDGPVKYVRLLRKLRRFHKAVRRLV